MDICYVLAVKKLSLRSTAGSTGPFNFLLSCIWFTRSLRVV